MATFLPPQNKRVWMMTLLAMCVVCTYSACTLRPVRLVVQQTGCRPTRLPSLACHGTCTSYTRPSSTRAEELVSHCQCCRERQSRDRRALLQCGSSGRMRQIPFAIRMPISCDCRPCVMLPDEIVPGEEFLLSGKRSENLRLSPSSFQIQFLDNTTTGRESSLKVKTADLLGH